MDNLEQALLESENSLMLLSDEELITPINDILIINPETRLIEVPSTELLLGVFSENLVEKKYFKCPRIVLNNIDLYECFIFINYVSANGRIGYIQSENVELDETEQYILFDWDLTNNVFDKNKDSTIYFSVSAKQYLEDSEPVFATRKAQGKMYETINGTEHVTQEHADIILQILAGMKTKVDLPKDEDGNLLVPEEGQTLLFREDGTTYYGTPSSGGGTSFSGSAKDVTYDDKETKLGAENVQDAIGKLSEEKADQTAIPTKTSQLTNDSGFLTEKPTYTASEVGADASGTAQTKVSEHNVSEESHSDIRLLISNLTNKINGILDSEDVDLDQLSELVAYIKSNRTLIESVTTNKVNVSDIIDNLTTSVSNKPLSAKQGVQLKTLIDAIVVPTKTSQLQNDSNFVTKDETFEIRIESTPDYTNQIPLAVDESGIVTGGLVAGKMVGSDGSLQDNANTYASWFIPVTKGDVIRVKEPSKTSFSDTVMFAFYKSDKATATGLGKTLYNIVSNTVYGTMTIEGNEVTWDTSTIGYYSWNDFAFLRVTTFSSDAIVTVNEPIVNSEKEVLALKSTFKVTEENLDFEISSKPMAGKTVVCFGDSLFGMYRGADSTPAFVAEVTGATVYNVGFGGCRMSVHPTSGFSAFSMWALAKAIVENDWTTQDAQASSGSAYFPEQLALLKSIDFSKVDDIVIHYGTNDYAAGSAVSIDNANDYDDYNTLCGALRYSIEKLLGKYPQLKIFVSLPVFRFWTENDVTTYSDTYLKHGKKLTEFVEALRSTASEYKLPVIDGYYGLGINKANASAFLSDGTHHNALGRQRFGEYIGANLIAQQTTTKVDGYSRKEIDAMFGSYVDDIALLVGGGA